MDFAQIGPLTPLLEGAAAAVGAGILLGGFATGVAGLMLAWPRRDFEGRVLRDGYIGGLLGVVVVIVDLVLRYGG
jgi:hypothetical protein